MAAMYEAKVQKEITDKYIAGATADELASEYHCEPVTIIRIAARNGYKRKDVTAKKSFVATEKHKKILEDYNNGTMSLISIADKYGYEAPSSISVALKQLESLGYIVKWRSSLHGLKKFVKGDVVVFKKDYKDDKEYQRWIPEIRKMYDNISTTDLLVAKQNKKKMLLVLINGVPGKELYVPTRLVVKKG